MILFRTKLHKKTFSWSERGGLKPISEDVDKTLIDFVEQDIGFALSIWQTQGGKSPESPEIRVFDYLSKSNDYDVIDWSWEDDSPVEVVY